SSKRLATFEQALTEDPLRRTQAAHLAYADGVLVCPTNSGAVLAVDLVSEGLLWAYAYRDREEKPQPKGRDGIPAGWAVRPDGRWFDPNALKNQWQVTAPIIQEGKVVFTAPDGDAVVCLRLRDGTPLWKERRRDDDVYLGGVVNG